ncbi:hypothetical protein MJ561_16725 [Klebsiella pneumoniae]|nr:hypothetical protein MJ561_16725 [Klebsiella pneumoniae]
MKPGGTIIDTGTTTWRWPRRSPSRRAPTVVTNSPEIAAVLVKTARRRGDPWRPCTGASGGCVGAAVVAQVQGMLFDRGFIGGCAMAPESGLTGFDYADREFGKAVIKRRSEILLASTDKIPAAARFVVAASSDIDAGGGRE